MGGNKMVKAKDHKLLTSGNPKVLKGQKKGYLTIILHLSPSTLNDTKTDLCKFSSPECRLGCLNNTGRGYFDKRVKAARRRKSNQFIEDPILFISKLIQEIIYYENRARKKNLRLAVRLNGTSDINFYQTLINGKNIFQILPHVQFYDYTKDLDIAEKSQKQKNHHITFSHSGRNSKECYTVASLFNIAVPFQVKKGETLPASYYKLPVLDGDENDLRFLDKKNHVVGLRVKGIKQKKQVNNFIITISKKVA